MKKCEECIFVFGASDCSRDRKINKFTGAGSGLLSRDKNEKGECPRYIRKPE